MKTNKRVTVTFDLSQEGATALLRQIGPMDTGGSTSGIYNAYTALQGAIEKASKPRYRASGSFVVDDDYYGDIVAEFRAQNNPYVGSYDQARDYAKYLNEK